MRFQRQFKTTHGCDNAGVASSHRTHTLSTNIPVAVSLNADTGTVLDNEISHFRLLKNVHAMRIRATCIAPSNRIVTRNTRTRLPRGAQYGVTGICRAVHVRNNLLNLLRIERLTIDTIQTVSVNTSMNVTHVLKRMTEV